MALPHGSQVPNGVDFHHSRFTWVQPGKLYLTEEEKRSVLARFDASRTTAPSSIVGAEGGLDEDVLRLCDRINQMHGVVTVQSCGGHPATDTRPALAGQVWVRLSEFAVGEFYPLRALDLAQRPYIYRVARVYLSHGMEVTWIAFQADDRALFDLSCDAIVHALDVFNTLLINRLRT